jgi:serine phosphatase RsbU (regulator of sigma subunit)
MALLQVLRGLNPGQQFRLEQEKCVLGRHPQCDVVLDVGAVSRQHAQIVRAGETYFIEDLKSRNGTYVNGQRAEGRHQLRDGDQIKICDVLLAFYLAGHAGRGKPGATFHFEDDDVRTVTRMKVRPVTPLVIAGGLNIPDYLAPQQIDERPGRSATPAIDLHAVGVVMYEMLLGESPWPRRLFEKLCAIVERSFPSAVERSAERGLQAKLAPVIDACLAGKYDAAGKLRQDVQKACGKSWQRRPAGRRGVAGERLEIVRLLFEDNLSEAFEVCVASSRARATLRLFKPSFQSASYVELARGLVANQPALDEPVPRSILRRLAAGRARPLPIELGAVIEVDRNMDSAGCLCLVEEYVGNRTLLAAIRSGEFVGQDAAIAAIVDQILEGLEYAHGHGGIHENLTPYCIFLDSEGIVKIEGFGLHAQVEQIRMEQGGDSSIASSSIMSLAAPRPEARLRAMLEITRNLAASLELDDVLPKILDSLFGIFPQAERGFIVLQESPGGPLAPKAVKCRRDEEDQTVRISRTVVKKAMESKQAVLSEATGDSRFQMSQNIADFRFRSVMVAPLIDSDGEALGVIQLDTLDQRRRFAQDDLDVLASVATQAAFAIENAQLHERIRQQKVAEDDWARARQIQLSLLPEGPCHLPGYELHSFYQPAGFVGGDYYDYVELPDGKWAILVADVSGKGIPAALVAARLSSDARFHLASTPDLVQAVARLNSSLFKTLGGDRFVTMVVAVVDLVADRISLVSAGHMPAYLRRRHGTVEDVHSSGLPLGVVEDFAYQEASVCLEPGDCLILYTDGLVDAVSPALEPYRLERLRRQLEAPVETCVELVERIMADIRRFSAGAEPADDMCLICLRRTVRHAGP